MTDSLKHKLLSGVFWQGLERVGSQGLLFLISIVLARLLAPEEFGIIAILMVFVNLCSLFVDSGFSSALIQKKDMTEVDCCSVFYVNIVMALIMYCVLFIAAPWIANFYDTSGLSCYLRIMALMVVIRSFGNVQNALLKKRMQFYLSCRINWIPLLISGSIGVILACNGFGVWALITQQLTNAFIVVLALWFWVKWRPQWLFDFLRTKSLFQFSWKLFASGLLDALYNDIYSLIIGKLTNMTTLSYYNQGKNIPFYGMGVINSTLANVFFPAFSKLQSDPKKMKRLTKSGLQNTMFLVIPVLTLLFVMADPLIRILLTEKWLPCVIFLRICCVEFFFWPFHTINLQVISACGRSDIYLILEIIKKVQFVFVFVAVYRYGIVTIVTAGAILGFVCAIENSWMNRKLIDYAPWMQLWDLLPLFLISMFSAFFVFLELHFITNPYLQLFAGGCTFAVLYLTTSSFFKRIPVEVLQILKKKECKCKKF